MFRRGLEGSPADQYGYHVRHQAARAAQAGQPASSVDPQIEAAVAAAVRSGELGDLRRDLGVPRSASKGEAIKAVTNHLRAAAREAHATKRGALPEGG